VFQATKVEARLLGLIKSTHKPVRVIDREGVIRLKLNDCIAHSTAVSNLSSGLSQLIDEFTTYGDAGGLQPDVFVIVSGRIIDLSGLVSKEQVSSLLRTETQHYAASEPAIALVAQKQ
jgi:hypothetical protein